MTSEKMKFIDKSGDTGAVTRMCNLDEIASIIKDKTGRMVEFTDQQGQVFDYSLFAIILDKPPINFYIIAEKNIPPGTLLFNYGGDYLDKDEVSKQDEYLAPLLDGKYLQAEHRGCLGTLLAQLPNDDMIERLDITPSSQIQLENVSWQLENKDLYFYAAEEIIRGSVIGFNYGMEYWLRRFSAPLLFKRNSDELFPLSQTSYSPYLSLFDAATGDFFLSLPGTSSAHDTIACSLLLITAYFLVNPNSSVYSPPFRKENNPLIRRDEFEEFLSCQPTQSPMIIGFGARSNVKGCMPPPGYKISGKGTTVVPAEQHVESSRVRPKPL